MPPPPLSILSCAEPPHSQECDNGIGDYHDCNGHVYRPHFAGITKPVLLRVRINVRSPNLKNVLQRYEVYSLRQSIHRPQDDTTTQTGERVESAPPCLRYTRQGRHRGRSRERGEGIYRVTLGKGTIDGERRERQGHTQQCGTDSGLLYAHRSLPSREPCTRALF